MKQENLLLIAFMLGVTPWSIAAPMNVSGVTRGSYLLQITSENNETKTLRVVID
jgi:hypothetical protein